MLLFFQKKKNALCRSAAGLLFLKKKKQKDFYLPRWHGTFALASDWGWLHLEETPSTQDVALQAARNGEPGPLAVIAARQTHGRGSRGRAWSGQNGNLFLSLLIRPQTKHPPGLHALQAGVALHDALSPYATGLMLKWPNDVLLDGAKLGGILIDAASDQNWLVIGIGANLRDAPDLPGRRTAALKPPSPDPLAVAENITRHLNLFATAAEITEAWRARAHKTGTFLDITTPNGHIQGCFAGIDQTGALLIEGRDTPISSGEIFLGTGA